MADLLKIAEALEKAAAVFDADAAEKTTASNQERNTRVQDLTAKYAAATGEDLSPEVAAKLAAGDADVFQTVSKIVEKTAGAVESLGRSSSVKDASTPLTKAERATAAYENFGRFIQS